LKVEPQSGEGANTRDATLLIVAGEVSGDIHAGNMLEELLLLRPGLSSFGVGGDRLQAAGLDALATTDELAHMGLVEVIRELPRIRRVMNRVVDEARKRRPSLAVLVDSPDFNLRLAKRLRALGIPVVLYVSPQLWAWRRGRVSKVRRLASEVLCLLPFEVPFYEEHQVPARYVGHPLVDEIARVGLLDQPADRNKGRLALLPGSRKMEVSQLLPVMVETLKGMPPDRITDVVLVEAPGMEEAISSILGSSPIDSRLRRVRGEDRRRALAGSSLAWTASGTATLECALLDVPMVVGYRLQPISFALAKILVHVPHVALVNLIAEERLVPELLQNAWRPGPLAEVSLEILATDGAAQRPGLAMVRQRLGASGASRNAAEAVSEHL
jgi:lipid-A-disaccharide synthase